MHEHTHTHAYSHTHCLGNTVSRCRGSNQKTLTHCVSLRRCVSACHSPGARMCVFVRVCVLPSAATAASNNICKYFASATHSTFILPHRTQGPRLKFAFLFNCGNCGTALPTHTTHTNTPTHTHNIHTTHSNVYMRSKTR